MAFDAQGWKLIANGGTPAKGQQVQRLYLYTTNDAASLLDDDGYFDVVPGDPLQVGDVIMSSAKVDVTPVGTNWIVSVGGADVTVIAFA